MKKLLIATKNPGKLEEIRYLLKDLPIELVSLKDLQINREAPEDGKTFEENAIQKAKFYSNISNLPTIADDGGLEIDALGGGPGVKSRRWFGYKMGDRELIDTVMKRMQNIPSRKRTARMRTVVALYLPKEDGLKTWEGSIEVIIANKPSEKIIPGYPFRSFMYLPEQGKFFVDVSYQAQAKFSHRGKAIKRAKPYLEKVFR